MCTKYLYDLRHFSTLELYNLAHVQLVFISGLAIPVAIVLFNRCNCCVFFGTYFVSKTYFRTTLPNFWWNSDTDKTQCA